MVKKTLEEKINENEKRLLSMRTKYQNLEKEIKNLELKLMNQKVALANRKARAEREAQKPEK